MGGKKLAQTIGIKAAKFDQLLFTDADCYPVSPNWIRHMQSNFLNRTEIILGYGAYTADKGLLNKWVRTDTVFIAMQYFSFALLKKAFMGVGRNLSYRKTLFFKNKGFASHLNLASGDDDLFINETSNEVNTSIELHPESFTYSKAKTRWKYWIQQKRRHLSTSRIYKRANKTMLTKEILSREVFYFLSIGLLVFSKFEGYVLIILISRTIAFLIIFKLMMKRLKEQNLLLLSLIYDMFWPLMASYLMTTSKLKKKPTRWK
jgi:biofilm PGA synthesis N-glycosyltransferase PgaC